MKVLHYIMLSILIMQSINSAESKLFLGPLANEQIEVPRKAAKRLVLLNSRIDKKYSSHMGAFNKTVTLLEEGTSAVSKSLINQSMRELKKLSDTLAHDDVQVHEMIEVYLPKIQQELEDSPQMESGPNVDRALIGTSGICCNRENFPCNKNNLLCDSDEGEGSGEGNFSSVVTINDASESVDCNSGALQVLGGVGIKGNLNVCGTEHIFNNKASLDTAHGALVVAGGVGIGLNLNVGGSVKINSKTESEDLNSGALVVAGGEAVGGNLNVGGVTHLINSTPSSDSNNGALVVDGGVGIGGNTNIAGQVVVSNTTNSTSCIDGAVVVAGGEGIGGDLNVCGKVHIFDQTNSTNCKNGALVVDGGAAFGKDVYICGGLSVEGPISTNSYFEINGGSVLATNIANCNLSVGDNTNPIANGTDNTAVGESAMQNNQVGTDNSAFGCHALTSSIYGNANTAGGVFSIGSLVGGNGNTAWGYQPAYSTIYNSYTTAIGYEALHDNLEDNNTAVGAFALHDNEFGAELTAVGFKALESNLGVDTPIRYLGSANTAVGHTSQEYNLQGFENTSVGSRSLKYNIVGFQNTAIGASALYVNESSYNTASGASAMLANTIGSFNTTAGASSMPKSVVGYYNDSIGYSSMSLAVAPFYNVVDGVEALGNVINPNRNVAVGYRAIGGSGSIFNPISLLPILSMSDNVAVGFQSLIANRVDANTAVGSLSLASNTYGLHNVAVGYQAMLYNVGTIVSSLGTDNTAVGYKAHYAEEYSYENTVVGSQAGIFPSGPPSYKNTFMGAFAYGSGGFNNVCIGDRANDYGYNDVIIGQDAQNAVDIFNLVQVPQTQGVVVIGQKAYAGFTQQAVPGLFDPYGNVAIGYNAYALNVYPISIGNKTTVDGVGSIGIGANTVVYGNNDIAIGRTARIQGEVGPATPGKFNVIAGDSNFAFGDYNTNIGAISGVKGNHNALLGDYVNGNPAGGGGLTSINASTIIGSYAFSKGDYNQVLGYGAGSGDATEYNTAIGSYARCQNLYAIGIGTYATAYGLSSIAIGTQAKVLVGSNNIAIGNLSNADGDSSIAIGATAVSAGSSSIAIGKVAVAPGNGAISIGRNSNAVGIGCIAIGDGAKALGVNSIAIGNSTTAPLDTIAIGNPLNIAAWLYGITDIGAAIPANKFVQVTPLGNLVQGACALCFASIPFSAEEDFFERNTDAIRSASEKLVDIDILSKIIRSEDNSEKMEITLSSKQIESIFPDLILVEADGSKFLKLDKLLPLMIQQLKIHHSKIQDYDLLLAEQEDDIDALEKQYEALSALVYRLQELRDQST